MTHQTINNLEQLKQKKETIINPIVLYSGGLDSSYLVTYLNKELGLKPIALRIDVGQSDLGHIGSLESIGCREYLVDAQEEFVSQFVFKLLKNGGMYGTGHFLSASLTRPLLAQKAIEAAELYNSNCILHCAVPTQNSLRRFNTSIKDLGFQGFYGSPFADADCSREEKMSYLKRHGIFVNSKRSFSMDTNLFCREFEAGSLENLSNFEVPDEHFLWTNQTNQGPIKVSLNFTSGLLTHINNISYSLKDAISALNITVGSFGIGRQVSLEEGPISKVVEARECPAAVLISKALYDLNTLIHPRSLLERKVQMDQRWATLACEGHWFSTEKKALEAYSDVILENVSGEVSYHLCNKGITLSGLSNLRQQKRISEEHYSLTA